MSACRAFGFCDWKIWDLGLGNCAGGDMFGMSGLSHVGIVIYL